VPGDVFEQRLPTILMNADRLLTAADGTGGSSWCQNVLTTGCLSG
jgi:hypothetical protein